MKYEITFITRGSEDTAAAEEHVKTVLSLGANQKLNFTATHKWGRRNLAYPIKGEHSGYYTTLEFESEGNAVNLFDHALRLNRNFIRLLITQGFANPVTLTSEHREATVESPEDAPRSAEESLRRESGTGVTTTKTVKKTTSKKTEPVAVKDEKERQEQVEAALADILADDSETKEK